MQLVHVFDFQHYLFIRIFRVEISRRLEKRYYYFPAVAPLMVEGVSYGSEIIFLYEYNAVTIKRGEENCLRIILETCVHAC